jgi:starch phosphorylase
MENNQEQDRWNDKWITVRKDMSRGGIEQSYYANLEYTLAKDKFTATSYDRFLALALTVRDRLIERWIKTQQKYHRENVKRVYYLSLEFLIGRLLGSNIVNLHLENEVKAAFKDIGYDFADVAEQEVDAGLGNGGLGRLAACFLDSLATLGIPAQGYGIRYDYGIFNQKIINGHQIELPDEWLRLGNPWEIARPEYAVKIKFYGRVQNFYDQQGKMQIRWTNTEDVLAMPYDIPVPGFKSDVVNTLRLWSARSTQEFDFGYFNDGDYERAVYKKVYSENISKVLYPNDGSSQGKELRLKQEYFFTAASIADIIRRFKVENNDINLLPDKVAIHLNDTHPTMAIPELMRILLDEEGLDWETAWDIMIRVFAYTNHTVMPEALETWPVPLLENLLPRHLQIIYEINSRFLQGIAVRFPGDNQRIRRMSLIEESNPKRVRMAYLCIVASHSINGVSQLHSTILKEELFKDFYEMYPDRFNNKTNGITQRRWLRKANPGLADLITQTIGDKWIVNLYELAKLIEHKKDKKFREKWQWVKLNNKKVLAGYIYQNTWIKVNPESMFDVQIKRIHEYKRQLMFIFYVLSQYLGIKNNPQADFVPRTFIFGGKSAPGYYMAKLSIKFINSVADIINNDRGIKDKIKVVFLENYRVSLAEKIFPASDLSEQISTAGMEASGTGCMKFMVNGALTMGTLDGANVEMLEEVGQDNIFIFGHTAEQIAQLRLNGYNPLEFIAANRALTDIFTLMESSFFSPSDRKLFAGLIQTIQYHDPFFICADFNDYCLAQENASQLYQNSDEWTKKAIINVAKSGKFSSDRTIKEYCKDVWQIKVKQ